MFFKNYNQPFLFFWICFWSLFFLTSKSLSQNKELSFSHLDTNNGLSDNSILNILQDSTGFIWLSTRYGLNRFDGRTFKIFKNNPKNKSTISSDTYLGNVLVSRNKKMWVVNGGLDLYHSASNSFEHIIWKNQGVTKILEDTKGNLWIGLKSGLRFKPINSNKIIPIDNTKNIKEVSSLFEDNSHHIWVGTSNGLFELFFINKKMIQKRYFSYELNEKANIGPITSIVQDQSLKYWIGSKKNGLYSFEKKVLQLTNFVKNNNDKNSLVNNNVRKILLHKNGSLWIGTQDGLSILNPKTNQFVNYQHDPKNPNSLSQNSIHDIFQDKNASVWIGTYFGGVNVVYSANTPFTIYQNSIDKSSLSSNIISAIIEDNLHNLWIGTEAGGLNYFDRSNQKFIHYKSSITNKNGLGSNLVKAIAIDKNQNVWIGTTLGGLSFINSKTLQFTIFKRNPENSNSIISDNVNTLIVNKQNKLFIGTDIGLNIYDIAQKKISFIKSNVKKFSNGSINALYEDKKGAIWVGTPNGIHIYKKAQLQYQNFKDSINTSWGYDINCFHEDSKGNIWVGTYQNGLALLNLKNNTFKIFDTSNGLPNNNILAIEEDNDSNLWISTNMGLVKYNRRLKTFRNFNILDGLPTNQFNTNSVLKDEQGRLFFGTYDGLVSFIPQNIEKNTMPPNVVLSNLKLFNEPVEINDKNDILKQDINFSNSLPFAHNQNNFTIEFSALNFIKSNKNKYAYRLDGFDKNWNYVTVPSATYTNLPSGHYQFLVKASNNDNIWSTNIKKIDIEVIPPIWAKWWAYLLYFSTITILVYYILKFLKARADLKQELHFEKMKLDFFTNVSHEIRTPLTLILGPIEKLEQLTTANTQANKYVLGIKNNTERLYRLVNELLDFRKVDSGKMRMYFFEEDIVKALKEVFNNFQNLADSKNIHYVFKTSDPKILIYFDRDQIEKVFFNLLSNAFKFTPDGGRITLKIALKPQMVKITVTDNGKGIAEDDIDAIFKNFYQSGQNMGTGIGLALTKSLVELHKGKISVKSRPAADQKDGKTAFITKLKLGKNHLPENHIVSISKTTNIVHEEIDDLTYEDFIDNPVIDDKNKKTATILIVDDNDEVREFIKQSLENKYHIYESENGLEGWKKAIQTIPDLIISDVMMPIMDGLELCKKIKTDIRTSHIPVILLTAKSAPIHQIQGLQYGADAYITKPFSDQILQLNIHNLLTLKAALQKRYSEQLLQLPLLTNTDEDLSQDEKFLQKLQQIIEANISNADLDTNFITTEIGMSKSVLYRKFSALTNLSLNESIKTHRLKRAVELFQKGETDVLEVAMQVGFTNIKYFSSEFKKAFGITPSDYLKNNREIKTKKF